MDKEDWMQRKPVCMISLAISHAVKQMELRQKQLLFQQQPRVQTVVFCNGSGMATPITTIARM
jgi:hypothetical protein